MHSFNNTITIILAHLFITTAFYIATGVGYKVLTRGYKVGM